MKTGKKPPLVSIGMPVYNGESYLAETLNSLLNQTFEDFELIISDNASTDNTGAISLSYAALDKRIKYFRNDSNLGAAKNYRCTLDLSCGAYFRWANADDLFAPESLRRCLDVLERRPDVVLAYPKTKLIDGEGKEISNYDDGLHLDSARASDRFADVLNRLGLVNLIYGLIRSYPLRRTKLIRNFPGGDIPLVAELSLYGKFCEIPEILFFRRMHAGASSQLKTLEDLQQFFDPQTRGEKSMKEWKILSEHLGSVRRAPIPRIEKLRIIRFLMGDSTQKRAQLIAELLGLISNRTNSRMYH